MTHKLYFENKKCQANNTGVVYNLLKIKRLLGLVVVILAVGTVFALLWYDANSTMGYLIQAGVGQARVLIARQPVDKVVANPETDPHISELLLLIADTKKFGVVRLGLSPTENYTSYVALDRPYVSWTLSAAPPDKLEPVTWTFPIVGVVPYLGFFKKTDALAKQKQLIAEGHDTYLRGVPAYSTLGWFDDPVMSPILKYSVPTIVNIILHEESHATVFIEGHVEFNETMASVMGNEAALLYLEWEFGKDSDEWKEANDDIDVLWVKRNTPPDCYAEAAKRLDIIFKDHEGWKSESKKKLLS